MDFSLFLNKLQQELEDLPGEEAQFFMAPMQRKEKSSHNIQSSTARKSGVLILLWEEENEIVFPIIQRPEYSGVHSGQMAFPGGKMEETDVDITETAIREAEEEIGIKRSELNVIGKLTDLFIPPSNFIVTPVISWMPEIPEFFPDPKECAGIYKVTLSELLDDNNMKTADLTLSNGFKISTPAYVIQGKTIWGATAMMLSEFKTVIKRFIYSSGSH